MSQSLSPTETELWVQRFCLFHDAAEDALQILRNSLDLQSFVDIYVSAEAEWNAEGPDKNPCFSFPLHDSIKQTSFFQAVEEVCKGVDQIPKDDYHKYDAFPYHIY